MALKEQKLESFDHFLENGKREMKKGEGESERDSFLSKENVLQSMATTLGGAMLFPCSLLWIASYPSW